MLPGLILTGCLPGLRGSWWRCSGRRWVPALPRRGAHTGERGGPRFWWRWRRLGVGYAAHLWLTHSTQGGNADILVGGRVGVLVIYLYALADRCFGLNTLSRLAQQVIMVLIPPLALIFLVLGTIFIGLATPTEGGAMGAVGALVLAG
jgi:TRAP-type mannitol/chloroaromatic compound transport system permease large subunit